MRPIKLKARCFLTDWYEVRQPLRSPYLIGTVKGHWMHPDGTQIRSAPLLEIKDGVATTTNSIYDLVGEPVVKQ